MPLTLEPALRAVVSALQQRLADQLVAADPHGRLAGRPMTIRSVDTQTLEIVFHEVPQISETEVRAIRRIVDMPVFCSVLPETERTVTVSFICHPG